MLASMLSMGQENAEWVPLPQWLRQHQVHESTECTTVFIMKLCLQIAQCLVEFESKRWKRLYCLVVLHSELDRMDLGKLVFCTVTWVVQIAHFVDSTACRYCLLASYCCRQAPPSYLLLVFPWCRRSDQTQILFLRSPKSSNTGTPLGFEQFCRARSGSECLYEIFTYKTWGLRQAHLRLGVVVAHAFFAVCCLVKLNLEHPSHSATCVAFKSPMSSAYDD